MLSDPSCARYPGASSRNARRSEDVALGAWLSVERPSRTSCVLRTAQSCQRPRRSRGGSVASAPLTAQPGPCWGCSPPITAAPSLPSSRRGGNQVGVKPDSKSTCGGEAIVSLPSTARRPHPYVLGMIRTRLSPTRCARLGFDGMAPEPGDQHPCAQSHLPCGWLNAQNDRQKGGGQSESSMQASLQPWQNQPPTTGCPLM